MKKITDQQLWDLADGFLSNTQKIEIEQAIKENAAVQVRFNDIQAQKRLFSMSEIEKPKSDFAATLLQHWQVEQQTVSLEANTFTSNHFLLKMVFATFALLTFSLLYLVFSNTGASETINVDIPTIHFPWKTISLSMSIIAAVISVFFVEKLIIFKLRVIG